MENSKFLSDNVLIERINQGEYELLHTLISRYTPLVKYYASKPEFHCNDFEDLMQDGLIALYSAVKGYDPEKSSFSTFASLCIKRAMIGEKRTDGRKKRIPSELCSSLDDMEELVGVKSAENEFLEKESLQTLKDNIRLELSSFEYKVLLGFMSGLSYADIADQNNVTTKSVDNALKRIRLKLKNKCV